MKELIEHYAWKTTLKNPYTGEELRDGDVVTLHNNKNGKTYKDVKVTMEETKAAYSIPVRKFFIRTDEGKTQLTKDFMLFADSVN